MAGVGEYSFVNVFPFSFASKKSFLYFFWLITRVGFYNFFSSNQTISLEKDTIVVAVKKQNEIESNPSV